jgi:predicted amidohydrolase
VSRCVAVGLLLTRPTKWDTRANLAAAEDGLARLAAAGAQVAVTCEAFLDGYLAYEAGVTPGDLRRVAEPADGPSVASVAAAAARLRLHVVFGFSELAGDRVYNSAALLDPEGRLVGCYRKVHLGRCDPAIYAEGDELPVYQTALGRLGLMICFDRQVPEAARSLAIQGAELLLNPSYGGYGEWNELMLRTRAYENRAFLAFAHPDQGLVIDPEGTVVARAGASDDLLVATVDLEQVAAARATYHGDIAARRRPGVYARAGVNATNERSAAT